MFRSFIHGEANGTQLNRSTDLSESAPLVVAGGLLTTKYVFPLYKPLLERDTTSSVPAHERFVPAPQLGLGTVPKMQSHFNERLLRLSEQLGRLHLVGHSLGALLITRATLDNPEIVASVTCLAGAHEGIRQETLASWALRMAVGNPPQAALLRHDSGFMNEHRDRVATTWPPEVPMHVISTALDYLIVPPQGYGLEPRNQQPEKRLIIPNVPCSNLLIQRLLGEMPEDVEIVRSRAPEHVTMPLAPFVLQYMDAVLGNTTAPREAVPADQALPAAIAL